jgi:hypothetical protein
MSTRTTNFTDKLINLHKMKPLTYYKGSGIFWFRIFGCGLSFRSLKHGHLPFSIRYGYRKTYKLFGYRIEILKKDKKK